MNTRNDRVVQFLLLTIFAQFVVIAILLGGLSNEYLSNAYMQAWVAQNFPLLGLLLHGEVDSLLIGIALGGTILLIQRRRSQAKAELVRAKPARSTYSADLGAPNHTTPLQRPDPPRENPEDVLAELEKQEH